jgi:arylsulfatase A-like enzyme
MDPEMRLNRRNFLAAAAAATAPARLVQAAPADAVAGLAHARPNILFILADDLGWGDLGCYGQTDFATPNLDALAATGLRLRQAYANSPVCSASRTALITGRYQYRLRVGLEEPIPGRESPYGLPPEVPTLPGLLRAAGYHTALVGKWHLGHAPQFGPMKSGYDEFYGNYGGAVDYFTHKDGVGKSAEVDLWDGDHIVHTQGYYTDLLSDHAVQILRRQTDAGAQARPLFMSLHYTAPHWPWEGPEDREVAEQLHSLGHANGGSLATYARIVGALDAGVGRVPAELRRAGLHENTLVVFSSDNGGERFSRMWPLTGQKTELLEGGIRVPAIVSWPVHLPPGISDQVAMTMDWLPTLLAAAGAPAYEASDGINLLELLQQGRTMPRKLYWRYKAHAQRAVRDGDLKYLRIKGNEFLFDLGADVHERANLAIDQPQQLAALRADWEAWDKTMLPIPADAYTHYPRGSQQADRYGVTGPD